MVVTNNAIDNTVGNTNSGVTNTFTVQNLSNTASSQAQINTTVAGTTAADCWNQFTVGSTRSWAVGADNSDSQKLKINTNNAATVNPSTGTNVWNMNSSGQRLMPLQPAFFAYVEPAVANVTGDNTFYTIIFNNETFDQSSSFNTGTGVFTAPITGRYQFNCAVTCTNIAAGHNQYNLNIQTTARGYQCAMLNAANCAGGTSAQLTAVGSVTVDMTAGDTAYVIIEVRGATKTVGVGGLQPGPTTHFSGFLVC